MESEVTHSFPWIRCLQAASPQAQERPEFWKNNIAISENQVTQFLTSLPTCAAFRTIFTSVYSFSEIINNPMPCLHRKCIWIFRHSELSSPSSSSSEVSPLKYLLLSWEQIWHDSLLFTNTLCSTQRPGRCAAATATAQVTMKRHRENLHHVKPGTELLQGEKFPKS